LIERLKEERVRKIIELLTTGIDKLIGRLSDDYQYVYDLGLIKNIGKIMPSNPIYGEVIARSLLLNYQDDLQSCNYPYQMPFEPKIWRNKKIFSEEVEQTSCCMVFFWL